MANILDVSTPPPPYTMHTPGAPQFGFYDDYQPYSPRRSSRLAQRLQCAQKDTMRSNSSSSRIIRNRTPSPKPKRTVAPGNINSPPSTEIRSRKHINGNFPEIVDKSLSRKKFQNSVTKAAHGLDHSLTEDVVAENLFNSSSRNPDNEMLLTPAKTPVKRPIKASHSIASISRNIFSTHPIMTEELGVELNEKVHRRMNQKTTDSAISGENLKSFTIFTDSHDRVPEKDNCSDNPFNVESKCVLPSPSKRSGKRRKIIVPGEGMCSIEDLQHRDDGLLYVFRGKKFFRKFDANNNVGINDQDDGTDNFSEKSSLHRPLTRSSLKPRLLFPVSRCNEKSKVENLDSRNFEEEEADTDIEDLNNFTSTVKTPENITTPKNPRFTPVSPPATIRTTRSKKFDISSTLRSPMDNEKASGISSIFGIAHGGGDGKSLSFCQDIKSRPEKVCRKRVGDQNFRSETGKRVKS